jgi:hypothetical protein
MTDGEKHRATVDAWLQRAGDDAGADRLLQIFEEGFAAMWRRAHRTLGEVTLTAIADRVLCTAAERFPILSAVRIDRTGLQYAELRARADALDRAQLRAAIRSALVEFLSVLGVLTAEILTPALHAELARLAPEKPVRAAADAGGETQQPTKTRGEDSQL